MASKGGSRRVSSSARSASQRVRRTWLWLGGIAGAAVVVVIVVLVALGGGSDEAATGQSAASSGNPGSADLAPDFPITLYQGEGKLGGQELDFSQLRGKPVVLNFWAGLCPPCRAEMPDLQAFYDESKDQVTLIGIDIGQFTGLGTKQDARNLLEELRVTYPAGFTDEGRVPRDYEVLGMPSTVFINSKGEIFENWTGALNQDVLTRITRAMLNEEGITPAF